jgi:hypothetical protein
MLYNNAINTRTEHDQFHKALKLKKTVEVTSTDLAVWALLLDALAGIDEVNTIVVVLVYASSNSQYVWVKYDVLWWKLQLIN